MTDTKPPATTTDSGIPAASDEFSLTVGPRGPTVLHDHYLVQKIQHFNRERVPERVVHAEGSGAHGFFEVTNDVTWFTKATFLSQVGKRTPMFARFSTVAGEQGYADTVRDPRGFALKFYTDEGNFDLVGNNTPVFFVRDATKFQDFIHSQKRLPDTGLRSNDMQWDFWTRSPESAHQVTILMSDRGTPRTWRNMNGYSSHTFSCVNAGGERFWVKYHFKTAQQPANFTDAEAKAMSAEDPDFHRRDLQEAIARGEHPEWRLEMQVMPFADAASYRFNPFDLTKVWPHADYPPIQVGRMVLDRNPANHAGAQPVYAPNSYGGPQADQTRGADLGWAVEASELGRYAYEKHAQDDDFGQAGTLYRDVMTDPAREHLAANIVGHASDHVSHAVQLRVIAYWTSVDAQLGARVAAGLGHGSGSTNGSRASIEASDLVAARANRA